MQRVKWTCPRCQKLYSIPDTSKIEVCPACVNSESQIKAVSPRVSKWQSIILASCFIAPVWMLFIAIGFYLTRQQHQPIKAIENIPVITEIKATPPINVDASRSIEKDLPVQRLEPAIPEPRPQIAEPAKEPIEIVFPAKRKFKHPSIIEEKTGERHFFTMISKADEGQLIFALHFVLDTPVVNNGKQTLANQVELRFFGHYADWDQISPAEITIRNSKRVGETDCHRTNEALWCLISLEDYQEIITSPPVTIEIGRLEFKLEERHLEAMRDAASRVPNGLTTDNRYLVRHELEPAVIQNAKTITFPAPDSPDAKVDGIITEDRQKGTRYFHSGVLILDAWLELNLLHVTDLEGNRPNDEVEFVFSMAKSKKWDPIAQENVGFVVDGKLIKTKCVLDDEGLLLFCFVSLDDFAQMITAKSMRTVGQGLMNNAFLNLGHMYALRDFSSRLPEGITRSGDFLLAHAPMPRPSAPMVPKEERKPVNKPSTSKGMTKMLEEAIDQKAAKSQPTMTRSESLLKSAKEILESDPYQAEKLLKQAVSAAPNSESGKEAARLLKHMKRK